MRTLAWVLIPFAEKLRSLGVRSRLGFFLHTPFPHFELLRALPTHAELLRSLLSFDLIGFQTTVDQQAFLGAARAMWGRHSVGTDGRVTTSERQVATGVFPIGVDVDAIARSAVQAAGSAAVQRMLHGLLGRRLIIGVDRLDYSKGLLERFEAYRQFLEDCPGEYGRVTYLQIAPLRRQNVRAYARIRDSLEQSAGRTNGRFADADWTPIRYMNRNFPHATLMGFLRCSWVCLVTPLRDGMNLVAKEFVAARDAADPGVLILSDRTGAAYELTDALLINPYDTRAIADAIKRALGMPPEKRREAHRNLLASLRRHDIHNKYTTFLAALRAQTTSTPAGTC